MENVSQKIVLHKKSNTYLQNWCNACVRPSVTVAIAEFHGKGTESDMVMSSTKDERCVLF